MTPILIHIWLHARKCIPHNTSNTQTTKNKCYCPWALFHHQILFGAPWIDCHSSILHHRVRSATNWLPSTARASSTIKSYSEPHELIAVHPSSTIEFGAPRIDCLALLVYPPPSNLIWRPMNWLPSVVHASSTNESGALRSYCVALFANSPFPTFFSEPHECYCLALFMDPPPSSLEPREVIA